MKILKLTLTYNSLMSNLDHFRAKELYFEFLFSFILLYNITMRAVLFDRPNSPQRLGSPQYL